MNGHNQEVLDYLNAPPPDEEEWICPSCMDTKKCPSCYGSGVIDIDAEDEEGRPIQGADNCPYCKNGNCPVLAPWSRYLRMGHLT